MLIVVSNAFGIGIARTERDDDEDSGLLPHLHVQGVLSSQHFNRTLKSCQNLTSGVSGRGWDEDSLALSELDCAADFDL